MIQEHLDNKNLHHAYLIEGIRDEVIPEIINFLSKIGVKTAGNPDFVQINLDAFKMDDAKDLKSQTSFKSITTEKKVFVIYANTFLIEAQNSLLKLFEEPIENTYFFIITPDASIIIKTLLSRFYFISTKQANDTESKIALKFLKMDKRGRLEFIKELLVEEDEDENNINSTKSKALKFLNGIEEVLHKKQFSKSYDINTFDHIFKVRKSLRQPGSSAKSLLESIALIIPSFSN